MRAWICVLPALAGMFLACASASGQTSTKADPKSLKGDPKAPLGAPTFIPSVDRPVGWRGDGTGRFPGATPPTKWSRNSSGNDVESTGILWMTPIPPGGSSPIVVGDRIFFGFDPYGLICISKTDGHYLWYHTHHYYEVMPESDRKTVDENAKAPYLKITEHLEAELKRMSSSVSIAGFPETHRFMDWQWGQQVVEAQKQLDAAVQDIAAKDDVEYKALKNWWEWAAATPVSDGKFVYMWFSNRVAVCYDLEGKRKWLTILPGKDHQMGEHGRHSSPILIGDKLIVQYADEVIAFDRKTGKFEWTRTMKGVPWATPTYSSLTEVYVGGVPYVVSARGDGFRVADGEPGWAPFKDYGGENSTPIIESGHIFLWDRSGMIQLLIPSSPGPSAQLTLGPSIRSKEFYMVASPLMVNGLVYFVSDKGVLRVFDPTNGTIVYEKDLPLVSHIEYGFFPGFSASPALAGKNIYMTDNQGGTLILKPGREYKEIAINKITTLEKKDKGNAVNEQTIANPFFDGKLMFIRGQQYLYCIGSR